MDILQILGTALQKNASDVHLSAGRPPTLRIDGRLVSLGDESLTAADTANFAKQITSEYHRTQIERVGGVDFGFNY